MTEYLRSSRAISSHPDVQVWSIKDLLYRKKKKKNIISLRDTARNPEQVGALLARSFPLR